MRRPKGPRVSLLAGPGFSAKVIGTALAEHFDLVCSIRERQVPRRTLVRGRLRRLGAVRVVDQLIFQTLITHALKARSRDRQAEIIASNGWQGVCLPEPVVDVESVNAPEVAERLTESDPDVIVISGTRILGKRLLSRLRQPVVNIHAGLTPRYRGVHGAYWALAEARPDLAGVTVHRVDAGIDTGAVLATAPIQVSPGDNFTTYPLLQLAAGLPLLLDVVSRLARGERWSIEPAVEHAPLRYHPGASDYLYRRWLMGVR